MDNLKEFQKLPQMKLEGKLRPFIKCGYFRIHTLDLAMRRRQMSSAMLNTSIHSCVSAHS